ncbi:hypothetical protein P8452_59111 [Trifolium repens]|nr:hypothetical protein P8452_59111 [Trifolium repens]
MNQRNSAPPPSIHLPRSIISRSHSNCPSKPKPSRKTRHPPPHEHHFINSITATPPFHFKTQQPNSKTKSLFRFNHYRRFPPFLKKHPPRHTRLQSNGPGPESPH